LPFPLSLFVSGVVHVVEKDEEHGESDAEEDDEVGSG
jgi:hypothetical protein